MTPSFEECVSVLGSIMLPAVEQKAKLGKGCSYEGEHQETNKLDAGGVAVSHSRTGANLQDANDVEG